MVDYNLPEWQDHRNEMGRRLTIEQSDSISGLYVKTYLQFYDDTPVVRVWSDIENKGTTAIGLEYVSSFALTGIDKEGSSPREEKIRLHIPHNTWYGEAQWQEYTLPDLGLHTVNEFSMKRLSYSNTGIRQLLNMHR